MYPVCLVTLDGKGLKISERQKVIRKNTIKHDRTIEWKIKGKRAIRKEKHTAGPAIFAAIPVNTNIPAPIDAPTPSKVTSNLFNFRCKRLLFDAISIFFYLFVAIILKS